jgi:Fe2+ transport system protein FeoA
VVATVQQEQPLSSTPQGVVGKVSHFNDPGIGSKLMAMGVLPDSQVRVVRKSPFGGDCYVKVDNFFLALRREEADSIMLK